MAERQDTAWDDGLKEAFAELTDHLQNMVVVALERKIPFHVVIYPLLHKDPLGSYPFAAIHRRSPSSPRTRNSWS